MFYWSVYQTVSQSREKDPHFFSLWQRELKKFRSQMGFDTVEMSLGYCLGLFVQLFSPTYSCSKLKKEKKKKIIMLYKKGKEYA